MNSPKRFVMLCKRCKTRFEASKVQQYYCSACLKQGLLKRSKAVSKPVNFLDKIKNFFDRYGVDYNDLI